MSDKSCMAVLVVVGLLLTIPAAAATREERRVADAADVLDQLLRIPEQSIPPALLSRAYAVAVIPNVVKVGFGLGARRGRGIIVVRQDDNSWSNPAFVTMTGGSIGWQVGAQSTDVILVFRTRKGVENIANGKLTLGADASVAAGPVGRQASIATDIQFQAEVVSYSRSRGLFAGVAFEGAGVTMDRKANASFYGSTTMTPEKIFVSSPNIAPDIANEFVQILTAQTARLPTKPGMRAGTTAAPGVVDEESANVRTFGMPDSEEDEYDPNY
ncbi:MAG: lipid-binding SYLF domain-containing protein [Gammaproteobacteria bacterium]|nr:lipid-binding SYLF domain-containing protein [Gammaproteobacteria bacterium]MDH3373951.1 lipid-binding SYLF domain-containing protein [Gammaproteobacteria bacterium]MDH3409169.1 lipid-binding SYLF domain-containing protein [Gammaproteobacteria bacterium]MDH3552327.1 lipid-binding SYLF domain-containing protein [Gammaproteobacteria bacterium]